MIDCAKLPVCEGVLRGDPAVVTADRCCHLAAGCAVDYVAGREDVWDIRAQVLVNRHLTIRSHTQARRLDSDGIAVRPPPGCDEKRRGTHRLIVSRDPHRCSYALRAFS